MRDAALLALLYTFALRASEAAALDWMQVGNGGGALSLSSTNIEVVLLGSKASPGRAERIVLPVKANAKAVRAWVKLARIGPAEPLLRAVTKSGRIRGQRLHWVGISRIVKRAVAKHFRRQGMPKPDATAAAARFSSHSGRVGLCVTATEAGVPLQHIAAAARHRSLDMTRRYGRQANAMMCAPHRYRGVGV